MIEDFTRTATIAFKAEGDLIFLIGGDEAARTPAPHIGQSIWLREIHGRADGPAPIVDVQLERDTGLLVRNLVEGGFVNAVHDVSDGGPLVAISEMALAGSIGAAIGLEVADMHTEAQQMFAENQGYYLVTATRSNSDEIDAMCFSRGIDCVPIGRTGGLSIDLLAVESGKPDEMVASVCLSDLHTANERFFREWMER